MQALNKLSVLLGLAKKRSNIKWRYKQGDIMQTHYDTPIEKN